jgi:cis-3-alkyl-4-acyloxetan-2-one decarboxylase
VVTTSARASALPTSTWVGTDGVRLHVVDAGSGEPVVMLHGNPTSSHLWRRLVPAVVEAGYRAVAPDQLGFGRSDKPSDPAAYSYERHVRHFAAVMDELRLDDVTLVVHDWGGPIALAWAVEHQDRVRRLILLNTVGWPPPSGRRLSLGYRVLAAPVVGDVLVRGAHAVVRYALLRRLVTRPIPAGERAGYLDAQPSWASRAGILAAIRHSAEVVRGGPTRDRLERVGARLDRLADKPTLIVWGMRDPILKPSLLRRWRERFPGAEVHELHDAGHFVPEDAHERLVPLVLDFLGRT